jgi:hypothetical protein
MAQEEDFRGNAAESFELAKAAETGERKSRLLILAQAWLQLAERARRVGRSNLSDAMSQQSTHMQR